MSHHLLKVKVVPDNASLELASACWMRLLMGTEEGGMPVGPLQTQCTGCLSGDPTTSCCSAACL